MGQCRAREPHQRHQSCSSSAALWASTSAFGSMSSARASSASSIVFVFVGSSGVYFSFWVKVKFASFILVIDNSSTSAHRVSPSAFGGLRIFYFWSFIGVIVCPRLRLAGSPSASGSKFYIVGTRRASNSSSAVKIIILATSSPQALSLAFLLTAFALRSLFFSSPRGHVAQDTTP